MHENDISYAIRGAVFEVYNEYGPGLLESVYEIALKHVLRKRGYLVDCQNVIPLYFKGEYLNANYKLDLLVENKVIVEIKSVEHLLAVHHLQLLTYLKLSGKKLGILVNFNTDNIADSIYRKVNKL
jgi:GxxExxY protein